jgi:hypothetical protein
LRGGEGVKGAAGELGLMVGWWQPPPLAPLVNRENALGRGGSGIYGADGTAEGVLSYYFTANNSAIKVESFSTSLSIVPDI